MGELGWDVFNECCLAHAFTLSFGAYANACAIPFFQFLLPLFELVPLSVFSCVMLAICPVRTISLFCLVPANQLSCILRTQLPNSLVSFTPLSTLQSVSRETLVRYVSTSPFIYPETSSGWSVQGSQ